MTLADKITSLRLVLAPVFFMLYLLPGFFPSLGAGTWTIPLLWVLFAISELSDMADGYLARRRGETSDFGRLFDPFADTLTQLTCFLCFVIDGILPAPLYLLVLYREYSILFLRNLMLKKGVAMGARIMGKLKTVAYILTAALALLVSSLIRLEIPRPGLISGLRMSSQVVFCLSAALAVFSFIDYLSVYRKTPGSGGSPNSA
jgi:CDP-diacylglycerol--glycerol-3-phosphate 3-phosphatidyltransferase